jgi:putative membrane protein
MNHLWVASLAGLPAFLLYFVVAIAVLLLFGYVYTRLTSHDEFGLIRAGNATAAIALGGSLIAFVLPLCSALIHSVSLIDFLVWAGIAFAIQVGTFFTARIFDSDLSARIARNEMSAGIFVATVSIAVGLINAACMTP